MSPDEQTSSEPTPIVLDATVLVNYARTDSVDWLSRTVSIPVTVHAVRQELMIGRQHGYAFLDSALDRLTPVDETPREPTDAIGVVPLGGLPRNDAPESIEKLDHGEAHALYRAWPDGTLATDDLDARRLAKRRHVNVTGSIGILVDGIERGKLSVEVADQWLETWRDGGYYSPVESVTELLNDSR